MIVYDNSCRYKKYLTTGLYSYMIHQDFFDGVIIMTSYKEQNERHFITFFSLRVKLIADSGEILFRKF